MYLQQRYDLKTFSMIYKLVNNRGVDVIYRMRQSIYANFFFEDEHASKTTIKICGLNLFHFSFEN